MCDILWDTGWCGGHCHWWRCASYQRLQWRCWGLVPASQWRHVRWPVTSDQACTSPGPPRPVQPQGVRRGAGGLRSPGQVVARVWRLAWTRPVLPGLSSPRLVPVAGGQASTGHCATAPPPLTYIFTFLGHKTTWQLAAGQDRQWAVSCEHIWCPSQDNP